MTVAIDCAFYGFLAADADPRISQAGKRWTRLRVGVGREKAAIQWVSVSVFGKAAETAAALKKSNRCYIEGQIKLDSWTGNDGIERQGLSVAAHKCERTHNIGRDKPKREAAPQQMPVAQSGGGSVFDDPIPFTPEWCS
jgi:single-strand DNA-binding protein